MAVFPWYVRRGLPLGVSPCQHLLWSVVALLYVACSYQSSLLLPARCASVNRSAAAWSAKTGRLVCAYCILCYQHRGVCGSAGWLGLWWANAAETAVLPQRPLNVALNCKCPCQPARTVVSVSCWRPQCTPRTAFVLCTVHVWLGCRGVQHLHCYCLCQHVYEFCHGGYTWCVCSQHLALHTLPSVCVGCCVSDVQVRAHVSSGLVCCKLCSKQMGLGVCHILAVQCTAASLCCMHLGCLQCIMRKAETLMHYLLCATLP